jgi:glutaredoxin
VREFLSDSGIPFEDRNIRASESARAELAHRSEQLVVPQLFWGDIHIVGFDPSALDELVHAFRAGAA